MGSACPQAGTFSGRDSWHQMWFLCEKLAGATGVEPAHLLREAQAGGAVCIVNSDGCGVFGTNWGRVFFVAEGGFEPPTFGL